MNFIIISLLSIIALGIIAALASIGGHDEPIVTGHDCSTCTSKEEGSCQIACLLEEKKRHKGNKKTVDSV